MVTMSRIRADLDQAVAYHRAGQLDQAERLYQQILQADPQHADALHLLGVVSSQSGKYAAAIDYITRAIGVNPRVAAFHSNLGIAYRELKRLDDAVACWRRALDLDPNFADAYSNLGCTLKDQGKLEEAGACCQRAIQCQPNHAMGHNNLGNVLLEMGNVEEAVACYQRALQLRPRYAEAHNNLGNALAKQDRLSEAMACYRRALEIQPNSASAHNNLGRALKDQGELEEAEAWFRRALELKPGSAESHNNLGNTLRELGRFDEALACFGRALGLEPNYANAHMNRSLVWLQTGDFERGWPEYEWRLRTKEWALRPFAQPQWDGSSLAGKSILLHAEQGLGDTIQFVRYASLLRDRGATVILECQRPLVRLLAGCPGVDQLIAQGDSLPTFDTHAPLMSLPGTLGTHLENLPANIPYLQAAPELVEAWQDRLVRLDGLIDAGAANDRCSGDLYKIGIAWRGNPKFPGDRSRSIPLECFAALADVPGVCLISLQKGSGSDELAAVRDRFRVVDLASDLDEAAGPFMDTAAVMMSLDLVVTCDSAPAHLAGALGVPVWLALSHVPDWRWLLDRPDSPWYPTARLFRQKTRGDWEGAFQEIQSALRQRLGTEDDWRETAKG